MTPDATGTSLAPSEAVARFLGHREDENTARTVRSYRNRLATFEQWADARDLEAVDDLDGRAVEAYRRHLEERGDAPTTVKGKVSALKQLLEHCASVGAVPADLPELVDLPTPSKEDATSDQRLTPADAARLLAFYRDSVRHYGTAQHAVLEVVWHVGARLTDLRALDLADWQPEQRRLAFRDRPATPLKRDVDSERTVVVSAPVADALAFWIERERPDTRDDEGRRPLFTSTHGRTSASTPSV